MTIFMYFKQIGNSVECPVKKKGWFVALVPLTL